MGENKMINFTTKKEYQGNNIDLLMGLGDEFCTFRQAVKFFNTTGKELEGAKSCATLRKLVVKEEIKDGKKIKKQVMMPFNVFEKNHLIQIIEQNRGKERV